MKILQLNFEKGWRGGERQTLYCMRAFRKAGHEVELMCRRAARWPSARARKDSPSTNAATCRRSCVSGRRRPLRHHPCPDGQYRHLGRADQMAAPPAGGLSRRTSFVVKPNEEWKTGFKWRHVDLFVAISEMAASEPRRLGIEPAIIRSAVEPHAINADNVAALVSEFQLDGRKVMATSAALIQDKDPVTLVRAVAELARTRRDFIFLHFGAGGGQEQAAKDEARKLGIEDVYRFAGFRKGVEDFYSVLDVFVMSSEEEALGSSVLDAFLQRVPVVSTDAGGLKESLADGRGVLRRGRPSGPGRRHGALPGRRRLPPGSHRARLCLRAR